MKKYVSLFLLLATAMVLFVGCNGDTEETGGSGSGSSSDLSGTVSTNGSTSVERVIASLIEAFHDIAPNVVVTYDSTGSGAGINAAREGNADIGLSSRGLRQGELDEGLEGMIFALDGIAIVINNSNPVTDLTIEQIAALFTGEITNWSEVGGADAPVALIGREAGSGTRDGFESIIDVADACVYDQELNSGGAIITAVASNEYAIGYASLSSVGDTVKAITVGGVACSEDTIINGSYAVQRPFVFVLNPEHPLSAAAQAFIDFAESAEARDIIHGAGVIQPR